VNWHIPEADGVNVWPNVSSTLDELGSQDGGQMSAMSGGRYSGGMSYVHGRPHVATINCAPVGTLALPALLRVQYSCLRCPRRLNGKSMASHQTAPAIYI